jgi:DNA-binding transcriptional LysR family regulator
MELRRLEHFIAVAEEGSFTRAARSIHLVQSGLSVSIKALEQELGAALFTRTTHRVELTDAGRALLPEARATIAAAQGARDAVDAVIGGLSGVLHIGIMQSLAIIDLASLLARFRHERPSVELHPRPTTGGSAVLVREVAAGGLDLAFVSIPNGSFPGVTLTPLASEPILLAVPPGHRLENRDVVRLSDLEGETFVESPEGWGTRLITEQALAKAGIQRSVSVQVADLATLTELVRAELGLGFVPRSTLGGNQQVTLIAIEPELSWEISLALPNGRPLSAAAHAFADMVLDTWPVSATRGVSSAGGS